jgi:hypothetical protein
MGETINWLGGEGTKNPNSEVLKAQIIPANSNKPAEANIWAGEAPKQPPVVNNNIEIKALDERAGGLTAARTAVMQGAQMAFATVPDDIYKCQYVEAGGGIYQIIDNGVVVGYAEKPQGQRQDINLN